MLVLFARLIHIFPTENIWINHDSSSPKSTDSEYACIKMSTEDKEQAQCEQHQIYFLQMSHLVPVSVNVLSSYSS